MITSLYLDNFKCFSNEYLPLAPLTILSGVNGMGKSTIIQALLLLRQSYIAKKLQEKKIVLNGPLIKMGIAQDILFEYAENESIQLDLLQSNDTSYTFSIDYEKNESILPVSIEAPDYDAALFSDAFYYLQAERLGPRTDFPKATAENASYNLIGNSGEFTPHLLNSYDRSVELSKELKHPQEDSNNVIRHVEAWLSELGQKTRLHLTDLLNMDKMNLEFSFIQNKLPTHKYRASNVGFGLTYSLPIFTACLCCPKDGMILIENPEAHLHPKGQALLGKFLAAAAASGIQLIVETHSDHILNGIRLAVKNKEISHHSVKLHFFDRIANVDSAIIKSPEIDKDGRIDEWPEGFFDEWEKSLLQLL